MPQPVFVTSLILSVISLAACSNGQSSEIASSPHCGVDLYGATKAGAQVVNAPSALPPALGNIGVDGIMIVDHPLGVPPEIARIRRGLTFHTIGGFINDGLENWHAVDLDANAVVNVERRYFSHGAQFSRRFDDPVFPAEAINTEPPTYYKPSLYARKRSDDGIISEEVISVTALRPEAEEAFVCTANPAWAAPPETKPRPVVMDLLVNNASLLDFDTDTQRQYTKNIPYEGALHWVMNNLQSSVKYEWTIYPR